MIDLHIHSICSDGSLSAEEIFKMAEEKGIEILSITDHDNVDAYFEIERENLSDKYKCQVITGIELATTYGGEVIEVLGYNIDVQKMKELLDIHKMPVKESKHRLYELMLEKYTGLGAVLDESFSKNIDFKRDIREQFMIELSKHSENSHLFYSEGSMANLSSFLRKEVFNCDSKLFIDYSPLKPSLETVIEMVHLSGGKAFLAHTFEYSHNFLEKLESVLDEYALDGIECYYSSFTREQTDYLLDLCERKGLLISGGSDFHGLLRPQIELGKVIEGEKIKDSRILLWI